MDGMNRDLYQQVRNKLSDQVSYSHDENDESELINELRSFRTNMKDQYMRSILNPEAHVSKVPSLIPADSATATLKHPGQFAPNANGFFLMVIDPFQSTGFLYNDSTVNGTGAGVLTSISFPQDVNIVDQWRLVSSGIILKYYGNFNNLSGYFLTGTTSNITAATQTTMLTFSNIETLQNKQILRCSDGVKLIFSPADNKAQEYYSQTTYSGGTHPCKWQYLMVIAGIGFPNTTCIRYDYFRNIEYMATPYYKLYIPHTTEPPCNYALSTNTNTIGPAPIHFNAPKNQVSNSLLEKLGKILLNQGVNVVGGYFGGSTVLKSIMPNLDVLGFNKKGFN